MSPVPSDRTTQTTSSHPRRQSPGRVAKGGVLTGSGHLLRLYLRRDRLRLLIWVAALTVTFWLSIEALAQAFPDQAARQARAALVASPAARLMTGPGFGLENYTFGALVANEMGLFTLILVAVLGITLVTRHTRAEEESGRMEMVRALPIGHLAPPIAALLTVLIAQVAVSAGVVLTLLVAGLDAGDSVAFGLGLTATGMVFAALAAVTAQILDSARGATGLALAGLGAAFLLRGIGDTMDPQGSWLSWASPIAWAQQTRVYVDLRLWPLILSALLTLVFLAVAMLLARRRDLGAGLRAPRPGPAQASARLTSIPGMAHRLLWGSTAGWAVALFLLAAAFGSLASEIEGALAELPALTDWVAIDLERLNATYAAALLTILLVAPMAQLVAAVLRWRTEEQTGRASWLILSGDHRLSALGGWLAVATAHAILTVLATGLGLALGMAAVLDDPDLPGRIIAAALASVPGVVVAGAFAALLVGMVPARAGIAWTVVVWAIIVAWLGELLGLPEWARYLSPLHPTAMLPADPVEPLTLGILAAIVLGLTAVGLVGFRRRDLLA